MTDLGLVGIVNKGTYDSGTTYNKGMFVYYQNSSWLCIKDGTVGVAPSTSATTNWQMLAHGYGLQNNATTNTSGQYALDAAMGKTLADMIPPTKFNEFMLPNAAGTTTFSISTNTRHFLFFASASVHGIAEVQCISGGTVLFYDLTGSLSSGLTPVTNVANKLGLTKTGTGTIDMLIMTVRGVAMTEDE